MKYILMNGTEQKASAELSIEDIFSNKVELTSNTVDFHTDTAIKVFLFPSEPANEPIPTIHDSINNTMKRIIFNSRELAFDKAKREKIYEQISTKMADECTRYDHDVSQAVEELMKFMVKKGML